LPFAKLSFETHKSLNLLPEAFIFALMQKRSKKIKAAFDLYPPFHKT